MSSLNDGVIAHSGRIKQRAEVANAQQQEI